MAGELSGNREVIIIYEKNGMRYVATYHGSKEVGKGLENKILKEMGLE